jgi:hypothetical protein
MTQEVQPSKLWFMYLAPVATHSLHQAPPQLIAKFKGKFDMGWDEYGVQTFDARRSWASSPRMLSSQRGPRACLPGTR